MTRPTKRILYWLCFALFCLALTSSASSQQRTSRVALVIGNGAYVDLAAPLSTTIADARALADELRRGGFEIYLKLNVGKVDMRNAIAEFSTRITPGTIALFYFSGFGLQVDRENYLVP